MSAWDDITGFVNSLPGAGVLGDVGNFLESQAHPFKGVKNKPAWDVLGDALSKVEGGGGGSKPATTPANDPGALADFLIGKVPSLTYGELNNPTPQMVQQLSQAISGMSPSDAEDVLKALPANSKLLQAVQQTTNPASAQQLYGFDPLSIANVFSQTFEPYLNQAQGNYQQEISNYGALSQANMKNLPKQFQEAYAGSIPEMQQAMTMQNRAIPSQIVGTAGMDSLVQNLTNATNAAKAAGQYASIAPYYQSLISGTGGLPGATTASGTTAASPMVTPFTYGSPTTTAQLQTTQAQQALLGLAQQAQSGA